MSLILGAISNFFNGLYGKYVLSLDNQTRKNVGLWAIVIAILLFTWSMKGSDKNKVIKSWLMFWLSVVALIIGLVYFVY